MRPTLEGVIDSFLRAKKMLRQKSQEGYQHYLSNFNIWCIARNPPIKYLEEVKASVVAEHVAYLKREGRAENTIHNATQAIKTMLTWASLDEEYETDVSQRELKKIKVPRVNEQEVTSFKDGELERFFRAISADTNPVRAARNKAIVLLLLDTGARASEISLDNERPQERTGLRLEDLLLSDQNDPRIKIMGKGGKPREVPVGSTTAKALRVYINRYRNETRDHTYLFLSRGTNALTVRGLEQVLYELSKRSGVPDVHPHKFRHTFAVKYLLKTKDIYGLSRLLGHTSIKVTERYLRSMDLQDIRKRGSIVDDIM